MAWDICFVKNIDTVAGTYCGMEIQPDATYQIQDSERTAWIANDEVIAAITHDKLLVGSSTTVFYSTYSDQLSALRNSSLEVKNFGMDAVGKASIVSYKPAGDSYAITSHNLADKCSWFMGSATSTNETLTLSSGTTYTSTHTHWIDLTHARHYLEDRYSSYYPVTIKDNGVTVTTGFTINYEAGTVTFDVAPTGPVTATYNYADSSVYVLAPSAAGMRLMIEHTEIQFSKNVTIPKPIVFEVWVYNPYDLPNKVKYQEIKYKCAKDFINSGNLGQGLLSAFAELQYDVIVIPYDYVQITPLRSSQGTEIRIHLEDDVPLTGEVATVTFYVFEEAE